MKRLAATIAAIGFLGLLYPEMCMLNDTCKVVYYSEDGTERVMEIEEGSELYYDLLSAQPKEIKVKSRFLEWLSSIW